MKQAMLKAGWVVSPNNIHGLQGDIMYPGASGMMDVPNQWEVQVTNDRIRVFSNHFVGEPFTRRCWFDLKTEVVFDNVADFLGYCREFGRVSEAGSAFSNSWD